MSATDPALDTSELPKSTYISESFWLQALVVVVAIFAVSLPLPQIQSLGQIPLDNILKNKLHLDSDKVASFFFYSGLFWYLKPFAGILTDAFPFFGTRRRHYLLFSSVLAAVGWIVLGFVPLTFGWLMAVTIIINLFIVMMSTVAGAFVVEIGQSRGEVGKLTAIRGMSMNACLVITGPLGGWLAGRAFYTATGVNAVLVFVIFPVAYRYFKEKPVARESHHGLVNAKNQSMTVLRSGTFWMALIFIGLVNFAPGFTTLQYFRQDNVLHLSQQMIGNLGAVNGVGQVLAAVVYFFLAKRVSIRTLLAVGVGTCALGTLPYMWYNSLSVAWGIDFEYGLFYGFVGIALMDLAGRASPAGCEALAYSLMMAVWNFSESGADALGSSWAVKYHWSWNTMVLLNALSTGLVLVMLPFMPTAMMRSRDNQVPNLENTGEPAAVQA